MRVNFSPMQLEKMKNIDYTQELVRIWKNIHMCFENIKEYMDIN